VSGPPREFRGLEQIRNVWPIALIDSEACEPKGSWWHDPLEIFEN